MVEALGCCPSAWIPQHAVHKIKSVSTNIPLDQLLQRSLCYLWYLDTILFTQFWSLWPLTWRWCSENAYYFHELITFILTREEWAAKIEFSHNAPQCEYINRFIVRIWLEQKLRCSIPSRTHIICKLPTIAHIWCCSKVNQFKRPRTPALLDILLIEQHRGVTIVLLHQEVLRLDVSVHKLISVDIVHSWECLDHDALNLMLWERLVWLSPHIHFFEQVPLTKFLDNMNLIILPDQLINLDDVLMIVEFLKHSDFHHFLCLLPTEALLQSLNGNQLIGESIDGLENLAISPFTQGFQQFVFIHYILFK